MDSGFTIEAAPIVTYKLVIFNKFMKGEKLAEYYLSFFTELDKDTQPLDLLGHVKGHLSELLDNLEEHEWTRENIEKVVTKLMCENPLSYQSHELID